MPTTTRLGLGGALALSLLACKKDPPPEAAVDPRVEKQLACERFAGEMARTMALTGQILVGALEDDPMGSEADRGRAEMNATAGRMYEDLEAKCMDWPEEVMRCLPPLGILREGCDERLAAAMEGATPAPAEIPPGPSPAWVHTLAEEPRALAVADDGTVLVVGGASEGLLLGLRDGAVAWRQEGDFAPWLRRLPTEEPTWVAGRGDAVVAFDPSTGQPRWTVTLPPDREPEDPAPTEAAEDDELDDYGDDDDYEYEYDDDQPPPLELPVAALHGSTVLVGDNQARFFRLDPARCSGGREGEASCLAALGRIPEEVLDEDARLFVLGQGRPVLWEGSDLRLFDEQWNVLAGFHPHDSLSQVTVAGDRLLLSIDDDVVELDPSRCLGRAAIGPSGWPQPGALVLADSDECEACREPPPGCRRWRVYVESLVGEAPALLDDGTVVVHDDEHTIALRDGAVRWKAITGGTGPLATDGTRILALGTGVREGDLPAVLELSPDDGHPLWQTRLGVTVPGIFYSDDFRLVLGSATLVAAYERSVVAIPLP
ncbi:MAG: PQQ-binding-like beta-propeller repeat protein [Myxococcales bacterium]|nr:PQQ-binding-like beta-propeller repeat protein [Myxococcales bacterium]